MWISIVPEDQAAYKSHPYLVNFFFFFFVVVLNVKVQSSLY